MQNRVVVEAAALCLVCVPVFLSGTAAAHGSAGATGVVSISVVFGATVVCGLVAGLSGLWFSRPIPSLPTHASLVVGTILVILGGSLLFSTATSIGTDPATLVVAGLAGGTGTVFVVRGEDRLCSCEADTLSTAIFGHRLVEGLLLGVVLDAAGGVAALAGAVIIGHAAVELAVVGRYYRHAERRARGLAAIGAMTAGFVAGAVVGQRFTPAVPSTVEVAVLAAAGCVLLTLGVSEMRGTGVVAA